MTCTNSPTRKVRPGIGIVTQLPVPMICQECVAVPMISPHVGTGYFATFHG